MRHLRTLMCRLRTASLPHPALRLDSLRAQRGNPVIGVARSAQNFYRGAASAETDELCTLNFELFITLAM